MKSFVYVDIFFRHNDIKFDDNCGHFDKKIITQVLSFGAFKTSDSKFHDYYYTDPKRPFCRTHIAPKLRLLLDKFTVQMKSVPLLRKQVRILSNGL